MPWLTDEIVVKGVVVGVSGLEVRFLVLRIAIDNLLSDVLTIRRPRG